MKIGFFILKVGPQLSESQSAKEVSSVIFFLKKMSHLPDLTETEERQARKPSLASP